VPSLGATARQHSRTSLGLHTRAEAMRLGAVAAVGLEGTLGHRTVLIRESLPCGQVLSIADLVQIRQSRPLRKTRHSAAASIRLSFVHTHPQRLRPSECSSLLTPLLRMHRISIVNSPQNLSVFQVALHVFTSSGATYFFGDNAPHSMLLSVLVSAPFTTEFLASRPNPGSNKRLRTDSPSSDAILVEEPKKLETKHRRCKVASDSVRSRLIKKRLHSAGLPTSQHLCSGSKLAGPAPVPTASPFAGRRAVASFLPSPIIHMDAPRAS
jgi:hypothetical protein